MSTAVFVTAGGSRWHAREDCEALSAGQQEASDRGLFVHPIQQVPQQGVAGRTPCGWCVREDGEMPSVVLDLSTLPADTDYERSFRDIVLSSLSELDGWQIRSQHSLVLGGNTYRPDFTLVRGASRIAIEVDGEHKGSGAPTHNEWTRRQTALVAEGWEVLRFTNRQVAHEPEYCRRQVAVTVARLRERERNRTDSHPSAAALAADDAPPHGAGVRKWAAVIGIFLVLAVGIVVASVAGSPDDGASTPTCPVKGNVSASGERIYHVSGQRYYDRTVAEECFETPSQAEASGYRASRI